MLLTKKNTNILDFICNLSLNMRKYSVYIRIQKLFIALQYPVNLQFFIQCSSSSRFNISFYTKIPGYLFSGRIINDHQNSDYVFFESDFQSPTIKEVGLSHNFVVDNSHFFWNLSDPTNFAKQ